jgi:hypothetical protein
MTTPPKWCDIGGYGTERVEERPSEEPLLDDDLAGGVGVERAEPRDGGVARY